MICQSCGAEYENTSLRCPYCHSENETAAERLKQEILKSYDTEAESLKETVPKTAVRRWTRYLVMALGIMLALGVIGAAGAVIAGRVSAGLQYSKGQGHIEKLEAFCESKDLKALSDYIRENSLYGRSYEKYWQLAKVYESFAYMEEYAGEVREIAENANLTREEKEKYCRYWLDAMLENGAAVLAQSRQAIEDRAILGNEAVLENLYEDCTQFLLKLGLSEEEIAVLEQEDGTDREELTVRLLDLFLQQD